MSAKPRKAALYARVSSAEQAQRQTIEVQLEAIHKYCADNDIEVVHEYLDDGVSGSLDVADRPAGRRLMADAMQGRFESIIVHALDRLSRDMADFTATCKRLRAINIELMALAQRLEDTPDGRFMANIHGSVAEWERERIRDRTHSGRLRKARMGKWIGGIPPYGYRVNDKQELELEPQEADVVREIFRLYSVERWSMYRIADHLDAMGAPRKVGHKPHYRRRPGRWRPTEVSRIIANAVYFGHFSYAATVDGKPEKISVSVPAVIDEATWLECEGYRKKYHQLVDSRKLRVYPLRGLVVCGNCSSAYVGDAANRGRHPYYRCAGKKRSKGESCDGKSVPAQWLEDEVWSQIEKFAQNPGELLEKLQERLRQQSSDTALEEELSQIEASIERIEGGKQSLINLLGKGLLSEADAGDGLRQAQSAADRLAERRDQLRAAKKNRDTVQAEMHSAARILAELGERASQATPETKRLVIEQLVESVKVDTVAIDGAPEAVVTIRYRFAQVGVETMASAFGSSPATTSLLP